MEEGWKEVYMTASDYKAEIARELLENAGIKAVVLNQHDRLFITSGEFRIFVDEKDKTKAIEILKKLKK
ncbi:MAG: DUF2007 domain-containing protein [Bacteroidota bacterium]